MTSRVRALPSPRDVVPSPGDNDPPTDERYVVPGLSRGLAVLQLFTRQNPEQKLTEIAASLQLSRSATYRLLYTLENDRFLARDPITRRYRLASKILSLGFEFLNAEPLTEIAQPFLRTLSDQTRAVAHLVIRDGCHVVYLARVAPSATLVTNLQIGARLPAHVTATGRILLAYLPNQTLREVFDLIRSDKGMIMPPSSFEALRAVANEDRAKGYVFSRSVFDPSVFSLAGPVRDQSGNAVAAVNVVAPHSAIQSIGGEQELHRHVGATVAAISEQIGFRETRQP
jgi:IclR family pca regulon transcriptional regulator